MHRWALCTSEYSLNARGLALKLALIASDCENQVSHMTAKDFHSLLPSLFDYEAHRPRRAFYYFVSAAIAQVSSAIWL